MNKEKVLELFKFLVAVYPNFEVTQDKINIWSNLLKGQNPAVIMKHAERYALDNRFPPSVSDLREKNIDSNNNDFLKRLEDWEEKAIGSKP